MIKIWPHKLNIELDSNYYIRFSRLCQLNTKIQPNFGSDLYHRIYVESNLTSVCYYWKPIFNIIRTKPKCIQLRGKFPKKKGKSMFFISNKIEEITLEKILRRNSSRKILGDSENEEPIIPYFQWNVASSLTRFITSLINLFATKTFLW